MEIKVEDIDKIWHALILHLQDRGIDVVEVKEDYYWHIPMEELYNPYAEPKQLDLGQLSENWRWLTNILDHEDPPIAYALVWLSTIMRAIGENVAG